MKDSFTLNKYLDGKVTIKQPVEGYKAGLDAVMLSAAISPKPEETVLDVGCGVGTIMLCCLWRNPRCHFTGIDYQPLLAELAKENIALNKREDSCRIILGSILDKHASLKPQTFDYVVSNPPYYKESNSRKSPFDTKAKAHVEGISLDDWLQFCIKMLKPRGTLALIYPTDRLDELLYSLQPKVGEIQIFPLWPKQNQPAKRVVIKARKQIQAGLNLLPGLILHEENGENTQAAQEIMRSGKTLKFKTS